VVERRERPLLAGVVFAVLFAQVLLYPGVPDLVAAFGARAAAGDLAARLDAGTAFLAAEFAGFVLFAGAWGAASDALGRRVPLIVGGAVGGAAGYAALTALPPAAPFAAVLVVRFLQGTLTIGAFSLAMTMLMDLGGGHGRNMGAAGIAIGLGTALGAPVGGRLYAVGPRVPLLAAAAVLVVAAGAAALAPDRAPERRSGGVAAALAVARDRPALSVPYAFGFVDRLTAGFFALVGTFYFQARFGVGAETTGLLLGAFFGPFALLQYPFGVLSDRIGRALPVAAGSLLYGLAVVAVWLAPSVPTAGATMVAVGVCGAVMAPATMALVTDLAGAAERGVAMGGFNVVGSAGFLVGIVGGGVVASRLGFAAAFLAAGLLEVAIVLVALPALVNLESDRVATFRRET
jgi:MFS family permease